jgi:hypothetical protein
MRPRSIVSATVAGQRRNDRRRRPQIESLEVRAFLSTFGHPAVGSVAEVRSLPGHDAILPIKSDVERARPLAKVERQHQAVARTSRDSPYAAVRYSWVGRNPVAAAVIYPETGAAQLAVLTSNGGSGSINIMKEDSFARYKVAGSYGVGGTPSAVAVGQFTESGLNDVVVAQQSSNSVQLLVQQSNGSFTNGGTFKAGMGPVAVATASLTSAGNSDVIVANPETFQITTLLSDGQGGFDIPRPTIIGIPATCLAMGEFNSDGLDDVAVGSSTSTFVRVAMSNGDGGFNGVETLDTGFNVGSIAAANLRVGGPTDLIVASMPNQPGGKVMVFWGQGNGQFTPGPTISLTGSPSSVATTSVGSYAPSIVVSIPGTGHVDVIKNNFDGTFEDPIAVYAGHHPVTVVPADLHPGRDREPRDLVTTNAHGSNIGVLIAR